MSTLDEGVVIESEVETMSADDNISLASNNDIEEKNTNNFNNEETDDESECNIVNKKLNSVHADILDKLLLFNHQLNIIIKDLQFIKNNIPLNANKCPKMDKQEEILREIEFIKNNINLNVPIKTKFNLQPEDEYQQPDQSYIPPALRPYLASDKQAHFIKHSLWPTANLNNYFTNNNNGNINDDSNSNINTNDSNNFNEGIQRKRPSLATLDRRPYNRVPPYEYNGNPLKPLIPDFDTLLCREEVTIDPNTDDIIINAQCEEQ